MDLLRPSSRLALLWFLLLFAVSCHSAPDSASTDPASIREAQLRFVHDYEAAIQSKDMHKAEQIFHPAYRACITAQTQPFFDFLLEQKMKKQPSGGHSNVSIKPVDPGSAPPSAAFLPAEMFSYPVKPTYTIQVDYNREANNTYYAYSAVLEVAPYHGSWYWAGPCPNAKGMEFITKQLQARERQEAETKKLAAEVKDPLLSQVRQLLKQGRRMDAIRKYKEKTGTDMSTASSVIDLLQSSSN